MNMTVSFFLCPVQNSAAILPLRTFRVGGARPYDLSVSLGKRLFLLSVWVWPLCSGDTNPPVKTVKTVCQFSERFSFLIKFG